MEHIELGMDLVKQAVQDLSGVGKADDQPKLNGRFIIVTLSPLPKGQRTLKFNSLEDLDSDDSEDDDDSNEDADIESSE